MHCTCKLRLEQLTECQLNKPACYRLPQSTNVKHGIESPVLNVNFPLSLGSLNFIERNCFWWTWWINSSNQLVEIGEDGDNGSTTNVFVSDLQNCSCSRDCWRWLFLVTLPYQKRSKRCSSRKPQTLASKTAWLRLKQ